MKKKLLIAVTNRSSYSKVKTIVKNLPDNIEPMFMLGGSINFYKYGDARKCIAEDFPDIKSFKVSMAVEGDDLSKMSKAVGMGALEIAPMLDFIKPDMVLTVADRHETLATSFAAAFVNIPLIHLQGGEMSGTIDDKVRNSITQLADFHFPATEGAKYRVEEMLGYRGDIWNYGCPSMDLMNVLPSEGKAFEELNMHGTGDALNPDCNYIIIMIHSDTVSPISASDVDGVLCTIGNASIQKIIFWPNIDPGSETISKKFRFTQSGFWNGAVRYVKHVRPEIFGSLLYHANCIVGNSSAGIREATFLGTPSITLGDRQYGRERGRNVIHSNFDQEEFYNAWEAVALKEREHDPLYGIGNAGILIAHQIGIIADEMGIIEDGL